MLTGDVRSKIDRIWNDFWSGGISNPLEVMEHTTYFLFPSASASPRPARLKQEVSMSAAWLSSTATATASARSTGAANS